MNAYLRLKIGDLWKSEVATTWKVREVSQNDNTVNRASELPAMMQNVSTISVVVV